MPSVTVVVVVKVTALLIRLPRLGVPMSITLPNTPTMALPAVQLKFPAPSVVKTKSLEPPVIDTLAFEPSSNTPESAEMALPDSSIPLT